LPKSLGGSLQAAMHVLSVAPVQGLGKFR